MLNPPVNGKIQGNFKAFECLSSTFKTNLIFKDFSSVLYIQVLFKPVQRHFAGSGPSVSLGCLSGLKFVVVLELMLFLGLKYCDFGYLAV